MNGFRIIFLLRDSATQELGLQEGFSVPIYKYH